MERSTWALKSLAFFSLALFLTQSILGKQSRAADLERKAMVSVSAIPTLVAGAYSPGYQLGSSLLTLSGVGLDTGGYVYLRGVLVTDLDRQSAPLELLFFNSTLATNVTGGADVPSGLMSANGTTVSINGPQLASGLVGTLSIDPSDYHTLKHNTYAQKEGLLIPIKTLAGSKTLYVLPVSRGSPTYKATSLQFRFLFEEQ